jgi:acid phosphatase (class A)
MNQALRSPTRSVPQRDRHRLTRFSGPAVTARRRPGLVLLAACLLRLGLASPTAFLAPHALAAEPGASQPLPAPTAAPAAVAIAAADGLRLDQAALRRVTGSPPAPGSPQASEDLAILLWLQRYRTPEMVAATWLLLDRDISGFSRAAGSDLTSASPALLQGLADFMAPVVTINNNLKNDAGRLRPYLAHAQLHPCLPPEATPSFPSNHATWFRVMGELLADLLPERRQRLRQVGLQGGANRVLCGVHYPSDVAAGQRLGAEAARQILASPQWRAFRNSPQLQPELGRLRSVPEAQLPLLVR